MYFSFLAMIVLALKSAHDTDTQTAGASILISLIIVWIYVLISVFPHGVTNLRTA